MDLDGRQWLDGHGWGDMGWTDMDSWIWLDRVMVGRSAGWAAKCNRFYDELKKACCAEKCKSSIYKLAKVALRARGVV